MFRFYWTAIGLLLFTGCESGGRETVFTEAKRSVQVEALVFTPRVQVITIDLPGRVTPVRTAQFRARVAGIVQKRHFTEGAMFRKGDLLFSIEHAPLQAALARTEGLLVRAKAQVTQTKSLKQCYEALVGTEAISRQAYDETVGSLRSAEVNVISSKAEVRSA